MRQDILGFGEKRSQLAVLFICLGLHRHFFIMKLSLRRCLLCIDWRLQAKGFKPVVLRVKEKISAKDGEEAKYDMRKVDEEGWVNVEIRGWT